MDAEISLSRAAIDALADDIAETAAHLDAATHRLLVLIRDFDRARGWHLQGARSCADWLSWRLGLGLGPAREKVRVAHRLAELPFVDEALRRGELSFCKVRAAQYLIEPSALPEQPWIPVIPAPRGNASGGSRSGWPRSVSYRSRSSAIHA